MSTTRRYANAVAEYNPLRALRRIAPFTSSRSSNASDIAAARTKREYGVLRQSPELRRVFDEQLQCLFGLANASHSQKDLAAQQHQRRIRRVIAS